LSGGDHRPRPCACAAASAVFDQHSQRQAGLYSLRSAQRRRQLPAGAALCWTARSVPARCARLVWLNTEIHCGSALTALARPRMQISWSDMRSRRRQPPTEYAATGFRDGLGAWQSLSEKTGLPYDRIAELGARDQLSCLFDAETRKLKSPTELRSLDAAGMLPPRPPTPQQRLLATLEMRWPRKPLTGGQAQLETLKHRWPT
jgi:hypothetical protein